MPTRIVLLEGTVGSGKSTTGEKLASRLTARGVAARYLFGFDPEHPIQTHVEKVARRSMKSAPLAIPPHDDRDEMLYTAPQWARLSDPGAALVIEGKYFQQCLEYLFLLGASPEALFAEQARILDALSMAETALIYFSQSQPRVHIERTVSERPPSWAAWLGGLFAAHPWGVGGGHPAAASTMFAFYEAWAPLERALFERHRLPKLELLDAHQDREAAALRIERELLAGWLVPET